jgi:hypothetical protein
VQKDSIVFAFVRRHLDPIDSLTEVLFGLIMVLTVTLGAGLIAGGEAPLVGTELLAAAVGCNLAWGVIDAVFYVMGSLFARRETARLVRAIREAPDGDAALGLVRGAFQPRVGAHGRAEDREALYRALQGVAARTETTGTGITAEDLRGGLAVFLLVAATAVPAAIPFLVIADPMLALRVSNMSLVALLFVVGFRWSRRSGGGGWRSGFVMMFLGLALTAIAIALGG